MEIIRIPILALLFSVLGCTSSPPSKVTFDDVSFTMPMRVEQAKDIFDLQYEYYIGFYKGNQEASEIIIQMEGEPAFRGTDSFNADHYFDDMVVGVSFFRKDKSMADYKEVFESKYHKQFETAVKKADVTRTIPPFGFVFYFMQIDDELTVVLRQFENRTLRSGQVAISFYKGIEQSDLLYYVENL